MAIPASAFVSSIPGVLSAGAPPLSMAGLMVTEDPSIPLGTVLSFANAEALGSWFGVSSNQYYLSTVYFGGYIGCTQLPGVLQMAQYNSAAVGAWLRGGSLANMTLAQLQALSGTISISVNGTSYTTGNIDLSSATSFSNAASIIQTALTTVSAPVTVTYDSLRSGFLINSTTTGTDSTIAYPTDSSLSPEIYLQAAQGAVIQATGAVAATAAGIMDGVIEVDTNWATFFTDWLPTLDIMEAFASWSDAQDEEFLYVPYDNDVTAQSPDATGTLGYITQDYNGVACVWNPAGDKAAFIAGAVASINFDAPNGRLDFAYARQNGLSADITNQTVMNNLLGNFYNSYVLIASQNQQFQWLWNGLMSGEWDWISGYVNQIYFNASLAAAALSYRLSVGWLPYNQGGYSGIASSLQPVITQMLAFGAAVAGGALTTEQANIVNAATGVNAAQNIQADGYYLSITAPPATVQQEHGSPVIILYYFDGNSINEINISSIDIL